MGKGGRYDFAAWFDDDDDSSWQKRLGVLEGTNGAIVCVGVPVL